jgi:hypothetical protein
MTVKEFELIIEKNINVLPLSFKHLTKTIDSIDQKNKVLLRVDNFSVYNSTKSICKASYKPNSLLIANKMDNV